MIMVLLGVAWLIASVLVLVCTLVFAFQSLTGFIILALVIRFAWWLACKDWGIGKHFLAPAPVKTVQLQIKQNRAGTPISGGRTSLDMPDWGIDPDAMP